MSETDTVPEYRAVTGRYLDTCQRPLELRNSDLYFINEDRLRFGAKQLEEYSKEDGMIYMINQDMLSLVRESLCVDVVQFAFNHTAVVGVLESIRGKLLDWLHKVKDSQGKD